MQLACGEITLLNQLRGSSCFLHSAYVVDDETRIRDFSSLMQVSELTKLCICNDPIWYIVE